MIEDDDNIVKDGQTLRVSMFAMDGAKRIPAPVGHRPGGLAFSDSDRQARAARLAARDKLISSRWKGAKK
jgi:hypothetical protein